MNKARRARQKANREQAHHHQNRAARTDEDGNVARCTSCRPLPSAAEPRARLLRRPMTGQLQWGAPVRQLLKNMSIPVQETPPAFVPEGDDGTS